MVPLDVQSLVTDQGLPFEDRVHPCGNGIMRANPARHTEGARETHGKSVGNSIARLTIFPVPPLGRESRIQITRGYL